MLETKKCSRCKSTQVLANFHKKAKSPDGHTCWCMTCKTADSRSAKTQERNRLWRANNKNKKHCHNQVRTALKNGSLVVPKKCSGCGSKGKLDAHHEDYTKPLEVIFYCKPCHYKRHGEIKGEL